MEILELTGFDWRTTFSAVTALILIAAELYAWRVPQGRSFAWVALLAGALILGGVWIPSGLGRMLLLDAAALTLAGSVCAQDLRAGRYFLAAVVAGALLVAAGMAFSGALDGFTSLPAGAYGKLVLALFVLGFAFKLAVIPFSFWLAPVAEKASPMTAVLVISLLDMAEFGELALLSVELPWLFASLQPLWVGLALLSLFGGAFLALAQTNLRRMLAFSTIDDMGYLLIGLAAGSAGGLLGALIGALSHALCKFLLFAAAGLPERDLARPVTTADRGLAARYPLAGAAFIAGALGMLGIPPLFGFLGRWRLYLAGLELGGPALAAAMAAATALALLAYVRAIHKVWLGKAETESAGERKASRGVNLIFLAGVALLIVAGLAPALVPGLGGR